MTFSILVANYNNGSYLKEALLSVKKQSFDNYEVIIVDDGSTDKSKEILKQIKNPRIKIFYNQTNKGCGFTKRKCVEKASGHICGFLDPDDVLAKQALEVMATHHKKYPDCGLIHSSFYKCDEKLNIKYLPKYVGELEKNESHLYNHKITAFTTFKMNVYNATAGINPKLRRAVDQDLYFKLEEVTKTKFVDRALYYYRVHGKGISSNNNVNKAKYWHLKVALDACERRGISKEEYFEFFLEREQEGIKAKANSVDYKLGNIILTPLRKVYSLLR